MTSFRINVYHEGRLTEALELDQRVVVGRRDPSRTDPPPIAVHRGERELKMIVADSKLLKIPRRWFRVSPSPDGFKIKNVHASMAVRVSHDVNLAVHESRELQREITIDLGCGIAIRVEPVSEADVDSDEFRSLHSVPPVPGEFAGTGTIAIGQFSMPDAEAISKMLRLALQVVQQAAGSDAFFQSAVATVSEIVDLDRAVLLLRGEKGESQALKRPFVLPAECHVVAEHLPSDGREEASTRPISSTLIRRVIDLGATVIHDSSASMQQADLPSLNNIECAVASPILDVNRNVIGVLYGDRCTRAIRSPKDIIGDMEATLVEILAGSVAGGMARQDEERHRSRLSEFFSPKVASEVGANPDFMEGQDTDVSVLFCDVRGFSSVTEKLGPKKAIEWINDVMSELSQCVIDRDGVLVDYVGDELFAMWGAPGNQTDHAMRVIEAARAMLGAIEILRDRWGEMLPQKFGAGIGMNTGIARVGNVGSRQKFKYGPLGNTVNLGARLQTATKQLGVDCLAGEPTVAAADCGESCRRLAKLSVVGIEQPIDVYEIAKDPSDAWRQQRDQYHQALEDFENRRFAEAATRIGNLLSEFPDDPISRKLLSRAVNEMNDPSQDFSGVWTLTSK